MFTPAHFPATILIPWQPRLCSPSRYFHHFENVVWMESYSIWSFETGFFFPLSIIFRKFFQIVACINNLSLFISEYRGMDVPEFNYSFTWWKISGLFQDFGYQYACCEHLYRGFGAGLCFHFLGINAKEYNCWVVWCFLRNHRTAIFQSDFIILYLQ